MVRTRTATPNLTGYAQVVEVHTDGVLTRDFQIGNEVTRHTHSILLCLMRLANSFITIIGSTVPGLIGARAGVDSARFTGHIGIASLLGGLGLP